jgi:hypothetical protein
MKGDGDVLGEEDFWEGEPRVDPTARSVLIHSP